MVYYLHLVVGKYTIHGSYGKIGEYKHPKSQGRRTPQSLSGFLLPICVLFPVVTFSKNLVRCFDTFPASNEELNHKSSLSKNPKNLWKNGYPSSHDHGSGQLLRKLLLEGPIFPLLPWLWEESKSHVCSKLWFSPAHRSPQSVEGVPGHILLTNEMYCTENQKARWQVPQPFHKHNIQQFQDNDVQPCGTCTLEIHLSDINKYQQNTTYLIPEFLNICNMDSWWHGTCRKMDFRYNMQVFKPFFVVRKSNSCNSNGVYSRKPTKTLKTMVWKRNPLVTMGMCWCFLLVVVVVKYANSHVLPLFSMSTSINLH